MAEGDSIYTFNYVTDDPCYGCKFAVRIPDGNVFNPWMRRFGCSCRKRRDDLLRSSRILLEKDSYVAVSEAKDALNTIVKWDEQFKKDGYFECADATVGPPSCYFKTWENEFLNAVEEIKHCCEEEATKRLLERQEWIEPLKEFWSLPATIMNLIYQSTALKHKSEQEAKYLLLEIYAKLREMVQKSCVMAAFGDEKVKTETIAFSNKVKELMPNEITDGKSTSCHTGL